VRVASFPFHDPFNKIRPGAATGSRGEGEVISLVMWSVEHTEFGERLITGETINPVDLLKVFQLSAPV
jgi:hypothetical protein